jgi:hypothetical protein
MGGNRTLMQSNEFVRLDLDKPYSSDIKYNKLHNSLTSNFQKPSLNTQNNQTNHIKH